MPRTLQRLAALTLPLLVATSALAADPDAGAGRRLRDLVRVRDGKLVYEDVSLCTLQAPDGTSSRFQVRSRAEAPAHGTLSRDVFVALVSRIETEISLGMADAIPGLKPSQALEALECDQLAAPSGPVDIELRATVTAEGLEVEIRHTRSQRTDRYASSWKQLDE